MKVQHEIQVKYKQTNKADVAKKWLESLPDLFAADFETSIRYSDEEMAKAKETVENTNIPIKDKIKSIGIANATAIKSHPSHCTITHCSIAWNDKEAYVFILDNQAIAEVVLDFLVETDKKQVWHNYAYDGRFIRYFTYQDAKNVEDTLVLAKTILNHVENLKASVGLKELAGRWYGDWGISSDNFTKEQMYEQKVIKYAATDACATYKLWEYFNSYIEEEKEELSKKEK